MTNSTSKFYITQAQIWTEFTLAYEGTLTGHKKSRFMKSQKSVLQNYKGRMFNSRDSRGDTELKQRIKWEEEVWGVKRRSVFRTDNCLEGLSN
tara:strand:- start:604 stop:882 length:279 start_codon:yes stop_codon:yes gene_type:complete